MRPRTGIAAFATLMTTAGVLAAAGAGGPPPPPPPPTAARPGPGLASATVRPPG
jgi:hypothetical protein